MSTVKRVVSVGAHSLDAELMGGPLLLKYAHEGAHVTCVHVTQGRLEDPNATQAAKDAYLKDLLEQNRRASADLGGDSIWLGYVSSSMMAALGMGIILSFLLKKKWYIVIFLAGFVLVTYFNLSTMAVAVVGIIVAITYYEIVTKDKEAA